jgi:ribosomal protein L29
MLTKQEIRQSKDGELREDLAKSSTELLQTKIEILNGYSKESHKLNNLKRHVARLKTILLENKKKEVKEVKDVKDAKKTK